MGYFCQDTKATWLLLRKDWWGFLKFGFTGDTNPGFLGASCVCDTPLNPYLNPSGDFVAFYCCVVQLLWYNHTDTDVFTLEVHWSLMHCGGTWQNSGIWHPGNDNRLAWWEKHMCEKKNHYYMKMPFLGMMPSGRLIRNSTTSCDRNDVDIFFVCFLSCLTHISLIYKTCTTFKIFLSGKW